MIRAVNHLIDGIDSSVPGKGETSHISQSHPRGPVHYQAPFDQMEYPTRGDLVIPASPKGPGFDIPATKLMSV